MSRVSINVAEVSEFKENNLLKYLKVLLNVSIYKEESYRKISLEDIQVQLKVPALRESILEDLYTLLKVLVLKSISSEDM